MHAAEICNFVQAQSLSKQLDGTLIIDVKRCSDSVTGWEVLSIPSSNCTSFMTRHC